MMTVSFSVLLLSAPVTTESPAAIAQRGAAEALQGEKAFIDAGDAFFKLAAMSGVDRRDALDRARVNYDSDYMLTRTPRSLCWALGVAELVVAEGGFADENEAEYWRDNVRDDLGRLRADARTTGRPNCRFDGTGAPSRAKIALLTDDEFKRVKPRIRELPPPVSRRWRRHTIAGGFLTGVGLGLVGMTIGAFAVEGADTASLRAMTGRAQAEKREFTKSEEAYARGLYNEGMLAEQMAIGAGITGAIVLTTGVALLATRKKISRRFAVQPHGGMFGGGASLRVQF